MNTIINFSYIMIMRTAFILGILVITANAFSHPGIGIVQDSKGNTFYTDLTHVWKIDTNGYNTIAVRNVHTHELYIDKDDNLFGSDVTYSGEITDKWYTRIWSLRADGKISEIVPKTEGFLHQYSFVFDKDGNSFFTEGSPANTLMKKSVDGKVTTFVQRPFEDIRWVAHGPDGKIYLVDLLKLIQIDQKGRPNILVENLKETKISHNWVQDRHNAMGIWFDGDNNIYIAIYGGRMIKKITQDGKVSVILETEFDWSPSGGLFSKDGSMWVLEYSLMNKARVRRIGVEGDITVWD